MKRRSFLGLIPAGLVGALLPRQLAAKAPDERVIMTIDYSIHTATEAYLIAKHVDGQVFMLESFRVTDEMWADDPSGVRAQIAALRLRHRVSKVIRGGDWYPQYYHPPPIDRMMVCDGNGGRS